MSNFSVLPLKGIKSLRAFNVFHSLCLGLKMLPNYLHESYEEFFARLDNLPDEDKLKMLREAALFVELSSEEIQAICNFVADKNGIPINENSIKNFGPSELHEIIVLVCFEISKIKVNFVSESEKKKLEISAST